MNEILDIYKQILDYSKQIYSAVQEKEWENVILLISKREDPIQETNAFMAKHKKDLDKALKAEIDKFLQEIQEIDKKSTEEIQKSKAAVAAILGKIGHGQQVLKAYHKPTEYFSSELDENL